MIDVASAEGVIALLQVVTIDLVLAGDNALIIGLAAGRLPPAQRRRAIVAGILVATVLRVVFAMAAIRLLQLVGLLFAGGLLLLWVCWKMWRDLRARSPSDPGPGATPADHAAGAAGVSVKGPHPKSFGRAILHIVVADVSMSLDNVLAVAGAAREHPLVLAFGLLLSIALMGVAASIVARALQSHRWIAYGGLGVVFYVACDMIYRGALELGPALAAAAARLA